MAFHFLILLLFILFPFNVLAQTRDTVSAGDSISAGDGYSTWLLSPSGDFSFGFHPLDDHHNNDLFLLSIWYAKIPDKTIVWYANGDKPAPKGSKVQLTSDRGLVLTSPNGYELWKSFDAISGVALAALNDTGNLLLQDHKFKVVWETFKDPRDTLLPTQILYKGGKLFSRRFETNFSTGRYQIFLQQDGNLVFYSVNLPSGYANENYFESGTVASKSSNAGRLLVFDSSGDLYVLKDDNQRFSLSPSGKTPSNDMSTRFYLRATLNFDGVFSLYQYPKDNKNSSDQKQSWIPLWSQPENICTSSLVSAGSGVCGYNSICDLNDVQRPICHCPKGYSLIDPNDAYGSCKPDFTQGCEEDRKLHDFEVLINTDWPLSDYVLQRPFTEEECKQSCLEDCFCSVAIFRLGDSCWKKKIPLSNGRVDVNLNNSKAFIKVKTKN
ncbi:G-type lectin S-receptor-like serine/threonine-protein kinase LECRK3 [Prosopis cineraria]|uniref:G-type lectin S-receptor-like serine/threonine-protein kinase LECRK3 n=1 Tax=Prosopis cineraria TaxID=364024 RepID=UPI0024101080|nr:G-type lectin S-receptor-like serine/threonine-protein kinase LECRK3 [Prosopis cineraria]